MKKILCAVLSVLMILSVFTFVGCGEKKADTLKFGFGVYVDASKATSATADKDGQSKVAVTGAVVTLDASGKIVACTLDTSEVTVAYTSDGKAKATSGELKTKYELGDAYNMVTYGKAAKEWYAQADAFEGVVVGKTIDEVKALVVSDTNKGTDAVVNAGCTIMIHEFVFAIEKACANATASNVTKNHTLKLGTFSEVTSKDATEEKDGQQKIETTMFAAAVDAEGKIVAAKSDCAQVTFTFDSKGASTYELTKKVQTKGEQGSSYGMVAYGKAAKEWNEQAAAFDALTIGKKAGDIASFMGADNYGSADVKAAGCTVLVNGFVRAAGKIG